jgi:hypothetical protein
VGSKVRSEAWAGGMEITDNVGGIVGGCEPWREASGVSLELPLMRSGGGGSGDAAVEGTL